jgi:hypothetical protein
VFLVSKVPDDGKDLARYREALLASFDGGTFKMFYSDHEFGTVENDVSTETGFNQVLFDLLNALKRDGRLARFLVAALRFRGQNDELASALAKPLGIEPLVNLARDLVTRKCPAALREQAIAEIIDVKLRDARGPKPKGEQGQWIDALVWLDELSTKENPLLLRSLEALANLWQGANAAGAQRLLDFIEASKNAATGMANTIAGASQTTGPIDTKALARILAKLYPLPADQVRVVRDAKLDETKIAFDASALNSWTSIVRYASLRNAIDRIVAVALEDFAENVDLRRAIGG